AAGKVLIHLVGGVNNDKAAATTLVAGQLAAEGKTNKDAAGKIGEMLATGKKHAYDGTTNSAWVNVDALDPALKDKPDLADKLGKAVGSRAAHEGFGHPAGLCDDKKDAGNIMEGE